MKSSTLFTMTITAVVMFVTPSAFADEENKHLRGDLTNFLFVSSETEDLEYEVKKKCELVNGTDGREAITGNRVNKNPFNAIADLITYKGESSSGCSGFFVKPRVVMTAAHCVYGKTAIKVCPGRDKENNLDKCQYAWRYKIPEEYAEQKSAKNDYALLNVRKFTEGLEPFDYQAAAAFTAEEIERKNIFVGGYPGDSECGKDGKTLYRNRGSVHEATDTLIKDYLKRGGGMSGGPVWIYDGNPTRKVIGLVSRGSRTGKKIERRITDDVIAFTDDVKNYPWNRFEEDEWGDATVF